MDSQRNSQQEGNSLPSRSRMLSLDEMLNHTFTGTLSTGPSRPAAANQNQQIQNPTTPGQFQGAQVSYSDYVSGTGRPDNSQHNSARHASSTNSPRSRWRQSQTQQQLQLPYKLPVSTPFAGTNSGYEIDHAGQRASHRYPYPPSHHHSTPHYRPDYNMSHPPPGMYNSYLPHLNPLTMPNVVPGVYIPPAGSSQNHPPPPATSRFVPALFESYAFQLPQVGPPQHNASVSLPLKTCSLCLEEMASKPSNFPFKCPQCDSTQYCSACLRSWFIDACKNESRMPPKCCSIIPLSPVKKTMTIEETTLYKAKFEEWMTPDKLYCPVPVCSAFIPPRLFPQSAKKSLVQAEGIAVNNETSERADSYAQPTTESKIDVTCPACCVQVCTGCRSFSHSGVCKDEQLDPLLAEKLQKWKIKRCPRCRTGVRRVFGCTHIECRCGAHFCWECMKPADECEGSCEDDAHDDSIVESDDLDGLAGYFEGDGHEFGPEPDNDYTGTGWNCQHLFAAPLFALPDEPECQRCFGIIHTPFGAEKPEGQNGDLKNNVEDPTRLAWQCHRCNMNYCQDCKTTLEAEQEARHN